MVENKSFLIDTHIFLWWLNSSRNISKELSNILGNSSNEIFLSVVSIWEILIKKELKKLRIPKDLDQAITNCGFEILTIKLPHVLALEGLPYYHKDPFDRMLVSQASEEQLTLVSADEKLWKYQVPALKCGVDI